MLSKSSSTYQPLKRSILAAAHKRQFNQSCILTHPRYNQQQQQMGFEQESQYNYNYLRYFQLKQNESVAPNTFDNGSNNTLHGFNSTKSTPQGDESWKYADLVHPHVAEFADLF